jgi:excisionase family DNA binding protein
MEMSTDQEKNTERYLSTGELMEVLSISRSTVYRLMEKGLPNIMVGSVHRFPIDQVLTWLKEKNGG